MPNPGRTPPPADGCCRMRPGCTSFDSLRSTNQHERSNACSCGGGGQSCSSGQVQLSRVRVCGGVRSSHYVEAATDRLLSTVPQRLLMVFDSDTRSATASSGTWFPPESDRKASIPGEYRAESVNIINRIRPLSYQLLGRPEPGPKILLTWTRGRVLMNTSTQVHSNDSRPPLRIRSRQCGALCAMGAVCRRKANRTRPATSGASTPPSERPRGCRLELFFPHRMCAGCAA